MPDRITRLLALQSLDVELVRMDERRAEVPRRRAEVTREITALEVERGQHERGLEAARLARRAREGDVDLLREKLGRYERQLGEVKTNVAYSALLSEIQGAKREIAQAEDEILRHMEDAEAHEGRIGELDAALAEKRAAAAEEVAALDAEEAEIGRAIEAHNARREAAAADVDRSLYRLYDRLRRGRRFPALVPLRGNACGACHGSLPPQVVREITHDASLHPCENCGVLIYAPERQPATLPDPGTS